MLIKPNCCFLSWLWNTLLTPNNQRKKAIQPIISIGIEYLLFLNNLFNGFGCCTFCKKSFTVTSSSLMSSRVECCAICATLETTGGTLSKNATKRWKIWIGNTGSNWAPVTSYCGSGLTSTWLVLILIMSNKLLKH